MQRSLVVLRDPVGGTVAGDRGVVPEAVRYAGTRAGFTLVELLVAFAIIGLLIGLLVPAVQYSREASRRIHCENNLKNQILAVHHFHDAHREFPAGCDSVKGFDHSWAARILPYLEQQPLHARIDFNKKWNDPGNASVASTTLPVFRCPSSIEDVAGDTDYSGVTGSGLSGLGWSQAFNSGVLIRISPNAPVAVRIADVTDGTSNTLCVAESVDRDDANHGQWADGLNVISHDNGPINVEKGEIYALHTNGAFVARADGGVFFLSELVDLYALGSLCTRNGGEAAQGLDF